MRNILVTGAAGFIGSHLSEALVKRGDSVVAIDEFNDYYDPAIKRSNISGLAESERFAMHEGDICDEDLVRSIFEASRPAFCNVFGPLAQWFDAVRLKGKDSKDAGTLWTVGVTPGFLMRRLADRRRRNTSASQYADGASVPLRIS